MFTWGRLNIETWRAAVVTDDCINSSCLLIIHHPLWPSVTAKFCYKVDLRCLCWAQSLCACTVRGLRGWLRKVVVAVYLTNMCWLLLLMTNWFVSCPHTDSSLRTSRQSIQHWSLAVVVTGWWAESARLSSSSTVAVTGELNNSLHQLLSLRACALRPKHCSLMIQQTRD